MPLVMNSVFEFDIEILDDELFEIDLQNAMEKITYPVLLIPWNSEYSGSSSFIARNGTEAKQYCRKALEESTYCKVPKIHIISKEGQGSWWSEKAGKISKE